jgi:methylmalonyl-CoA/ethylmalonyl-CoA epimerase
MTSASPAAPDNGLSFHHVGMVVKDIAAAARRLTSGLGLQWDGKIFEDPVQTVKVSFLLHPDTHQPALELVEPSSPRSKVAAFLGKSGGCHHVCYEVDCIDTAVARVRQSGAVVLQKPVPAVAFDGRHIAWVFTSDRILIEFLAKSKP